MAITPAGEITIAAHRLGNLLSDLPEDDWGDHPWHVEACDEERPGRCRCIVAQGERRPLEEQQIPPVRYIADAKAPEFARYIAVMGANLGWILLRQMHDEAERLATTVPPSEQEKVAPHLVALAREINKQFEREEGR